MIFIQIKRVFFKGKRERVFLYEFGKTQISLPVCQSIFFPLGFAWEQAVVCHVRNSTARLLDHVHRGAVQLPGDLEAKECLQLLNLLHYGVASSCNHLTNLVPSFPCVILVEIHLKGRGRLTHLQHSLWEALTLQQCLPDV